MQRRVRHLFIASIVSLTSVILASGCADPPPAPADGKLQVFITGNIRGAVSPCGCKISKGGIARLATYIQRHQKPDANWLTVDAGNFVDQPAIGIGCTKKCEFVLASYGDLRYDVVNIARQEVAMGYETLKALRDTTKNVNFVSANLIDANSGRLMFDPYVIKDYGNMRIGVLGLLREAEFAAPSSKLDTIALRVTESLAAADKYIGDLTRRTNSVIVLCDLASEEVQALIAAHPEIDLVITSSPLQKAETTKKIGRTRVMGTGSSGYNGHYARFEFNPAWGDSFGFYDHMDALTDTYEQAGEWSDKLTAFELANGVAKVPAANPAKIPPGQSVSPSAIAPTNVSPLAVEKKG